MKNFQWLKAVCTAVVATWFCGCELNSSSPEVAEPATQQTQTTDTVTTPPSTTVPTTAPAAPVGSADDLDISAAKSYAPTAYPTAPGASITRMLFSANISGDHVNLSFESLNWPEKSGAKTIDGGVYIFWLEGSQVVGGYFDAHAVGQTSKGLENIHGGYLNGHRPPRGATVYFALVSIDGKQRTNVKRSETTW